MCTYMVFDIFILLCSNHHSLMDVLIFNYQFVWKMQDKCLSVFPLYKFLELGGDALPTSKDDSGGYF